MSPNKNPVFTVGHSNRTIADFLDLLAPEQVDFVVDIRTVPRSRTNPQFNSDALPGALASSGITYLHVPELGGLRARSKNIAPAINAFWANQSFHNYADYAVSAAFQRGLSQLMDFSRAHRCAIMCSEAVWWRCHRRIVTDYLIKSGVEVFHLMGSGRVERASMTPAAVLNGDVINYPLPSTQGVQKRRG